MTLMTVPNVIDGKSVAGSSTDTLEVLDPSTGEVIASFTESTPGDVDDAVQAAKAAFPAWAAKSPAQRSEALHALADLFAQDLAEFARIESIDAGKPITAATEEELPGILGALRHFAGAGRVLAAQAAGEHAGVHESFHRVGSTSASPGRRQCRQRPRPSRRRGPGQASRRQLGLLHR